MADPDVADIERRMHSAVEVLRREFAGLRTGRASAALLEPITVDAYGAKMPMSQVGTISVPDPRMLTIQVWDNGLVKFVEKAVRDSGLGLNPQTEGNVLRIPVPELTEERRMELAKIANKYAEQAKVAVRNVRRDGMDKLKRLEKDSEISKDEARIWSQDIQKLTDENIKSMDELLEAKDKDIMQV
ncbi:MAG: ribosome recycling factor [Rhodospirillales bacterium]|nr:ribosome recycling factor [Rhodospirillales bacterium]